MTKQLQSAVGTQRPAISPCLGDGVDGLVTVETQPFGGDGGTDDLDEDDVIETDMVLDAALR